MAASIQNLLAQVIGHQQTIANLLLMAKRERVPNSLLFVGPREVGKKRVAFGFAQALNCEKFNLQTGACGVCPSCLRIARQQSENVILLEPEKGVIKIEEARSVIQQLSLSALGRRRVVIIDEAQLLNLQAANVLLKVIEEPPEKTHFILISSSQEAVLSTLRSRSQVVRFRGLTREELSRLDRSPIDLEVRDLAFKYWQQVLLGHDEVAVEFAREHFENRDRGLQVARFCFEFARDLWVLSLGREDLLHVDLQNEYQTELQKQSISARYLAGLGEEVLNCERALVGHCDMQLTFENFVYQAQKIRGLST
jgi:hypothetical protein